MSCHEYRYLIQHRFDEDLDSDEVASVDDHIDQCESCAKFEHQLDQMIQGAEEMPLPEELTPPNPEALAKMVQDKLPQQKSSVFSMFTDIFKGSSGGGSAQTARSKASKAASDKTDFPKRNKTAAGAEKDRKKSAEDSADDLAVASRLKSLAREPDESRDVQSTTKGLGEKFGFGSNSLNAADSATPLTLAESIRRKISESQKLSVDDEADSADERLTPAASTGTGDWNAPIKMSGQPQPDPGWTPGGAAATPNTWSPQQANQNPGPPSVHPGSNIGLSPPGGGPGGQPEGWSEDKRPPKGTNPGDADSGWGPPPAGGTWEEAQAAAAAQAQEAQGAGSWGAGGQSSWANTPSPAEPAAAAAAAGWAGGGGGAAVTSWGAAPSQPAEPQAAAQPQGWSDGSAGGGSAGGGGASWDAPKSDSATASGSWAPTPAVAAKPTGGDAWGGATGTGGESWGAPPNAAQDSWGGGAAGGAAAGGDSWGGGGQAAQAPAPAPAPAPQAPPAPAAPAATDDSWGKQQPQAAGSGWGGGAQQASNWGSSPQAAAPAPAPAQPAADASSWGGTPAQAGGGGGGGWGGAPQGAENPGGGWGGASSAAQAAPAPSASGDWTATSGEKSGGWGTPGAAPAAPAAQQQAETPGWGAPQNQSGWENQPWDDKSDPNKQRGNWSIEAEQMETGTWSNYSGANAPAGGLGAKPPSQASQVASEIAQQDRWDKPIQERGPEAGPADPNRFEMPIQDRPPQAPAAAQAAGADSHWDVPIQEKMKGKTDPAMAPPATPGGAPGWGAAPAAPAAPAQGGTGESHWDLPIQEKLKQQQAAAQSPGTVPVYPAPASDNAPVQPFNAPPAFGGAPPDNAFGSQPAAQPPAFGAPPAGAPGAPPAFGAAPSPGAPPAFGAPPAGAPSAPPAFGAAPTPGAPPAFGAAPGAPPPAFGAPTGAPAFGAPSAEPPAAAPPTFGAPPAPSFGAPPTPAPAPAAPAPATTWGAPSAPAASAGLFNKPLDDSAMDQIFDGLGIKESGVQPVQAAAHQPATLQQAPQMPQPQAAPPAMQSAGGWGSPPAPPAAQPGVPDTMSFAPEVPPAEAPRLTAIPQKPPTIEAPAPMPMPAPPPVAPPAMAQAPAAPQIAPAQSKRGSGMFQLDDDAVDQIFAKIGVEESSIPVNQQGAPAPAMPAPQAPPAMPQPPALAPPALGQAPGMPGMPGMSPPPPPAMPQQQAPQAGAPPTFGMAPPSGFGAPPAGMPAPPMPPQMPPAPPQQQQNKSGLFQVDDGDMDNLFDKVLLNPGQDNRGAPVNSPMAQQPQMGAPGQPPMGFGQPPGNGQYPASGQAPSMPGMPPMPAAMPGMPSAPEPPPQAVSYVPSSQLPPPKIEGIGKLDASADVAETGSGRIAAIGKFLLDQKDLEKLSKITAADQQDIKMRILTLEASEDLQTLLSEIGGQEKVIGSVIVGHDGLLIANTMPEEVDAESIGVWALGVYMNTEHVTKKMGHERVHQVVSRTPRGYVVIADFGGGLLVTITEGTDTDTLIPLMRKITDLVS